MFALGALVFFPSRAQQARAKGEANVKANNHDLKVPKNSSSEK